jgi:hypothetical protein
MIQTQTPIYMQFSFPTQTIAQATAQTITQKVSRLFSLNSTLTLRFLVFGLFFTCFFGNQGLVAQIPFKNTSFESLDATGTQPLYWEWSKTKSYTFSAETATDAPQGTMVARLGSTGLKTVNNGAVFMQAYQMKAEGLRKVRYSVAIKTENVSGTAGGLFNIFVNRFAIANTEMADKFIGGTTGWKRYTSEIICPSATNSVSFGGVVRGDGTAWFDDFKIEELPYTPPPLAEKAQGVSNEFFAILKKHSIRRDSVSLPNLERDVQALAIGATDVTGCYSAFQYTMAALSDRRALFFEPEKAEEWLKNRTNVPLEAPMPTGGVFQEKYGFIKITSAETLDSSYMQRYADSLHSLVRSIEKQAGAKLKGWIIDFRISQTSDIHAFLNGFSPFYKLNADTLGFKRLADGSLQPLIVGDKLKVQDPVKLKKRLPIAIMQGAPTAGAAEMVISTLNQQPQTRIFGEKSRGDAHFTGLHRLSTGELLHFSEAGFSSLKGVPLNEGIRPDVEITYPRDNSMTVFEDPVVRAATLWLDNIKLEK